MHTVLSFIIDNLATVIGAAFLTAITAQIIFNVKFRLKTLFIYAATFIFTFGTIVAFSDYVLIKVSPNLAMTFRTVFCALSAILMLKYFLKLSLVKSVIAAFFYLVLLAIGNVVMTLIFKTFGVELDEIRMSLAQTLIGLAIINSVVVIILALIKSFKLFSSLPAELRTKAYRTNIIYILLVFAIMVLNFNYYENFGELTDGITVTLSILLLITFLLFSLFNTNTFFKLETKSQELEYQLFYNKALDSIIKDLRRFKHNYNNILAVFGGYIKTKKWDEMERYYSEICGQMGKVSFFDNLTSLNIKSAGVLGLIMTKYEYAMEKDVELRVVASGEIGEIKMKISEFCEVLGILMDNAIEAASESEGKVVELFMGSKDGILSFAIENAVSGQVNVARIYEQGYSSKGEGRGLGLGIMRSIIAKYKNVMLNTHAEESRFRQEIIINS